MAISLEAASEVYRQAMRDAVRRYALWYLVQGALLIAVGVLAILYPLIASTAVVIMLGWFLLISGVLQGLGLIAARKAPHAWLQLVSVVLALLIGFLILRDPVQSLVTITLLVLVFFMIEGVAKLVLALTIRPFPTWGWVLASGIFSIALSVFLLTNVSEVADWLVALLIGLQFIAAGAAIAYMAWRVRAS